MDQKNIPQGKARLNGWQLLIFSLVAMTVLLFAVSFARPAVAGDDAPSDTPSISASEAMERFLADQQPAQELEKMAFTPCVGGFAGSYPCNNVDLYAFMPLASIGAGSGNDVWGWTDSGSGREFALMGLSNGTSFVEITDPVNPVYLGRLPTHTSNSSWRDIKVYQNHAFIGSEAGGHGMQVFALSNLLNVANPPVIFSATAHYNGFGNSHNIAINEATGFAYAIGSNTCSGGLHMVNIQNPTSPTNAGCYSGDGYTHDTQCVIYNGPDAQHQGKEICFSSNEDTLTVTDVTNKGAPVLITKKTYAGSAYTHQGWLTEDHKYFLLDDELDESNFGHNTRTRVWDVTNVDNPVIIGVFDGTTAAIDHNQYVKGNYSYQADYRAGLRILDITNVSSGSLNEAAYFDIYPTSNSAAFNGAWSVYPFFPSGVIVVSGIEQGLFILQPNLGGGPTPTPTATGPTPTPTNTPVGPTPTPTKTPRGTAVPTATPTAPSGSTMHVGDLDGSSVPNANGWNATVTFTVHDASHNPVSGAVVTGSWSSGATGSANCTTNASGQCSVSKTGIRNTSNSVTFTVTNVTKSGFSYQSGSNHDPDGDSTGTVIVVAKP